MDQKKFTQYATILVAAVWVFCGTFMVSAKVIKDKKAVAATPQTQITTAPNLTMAPATTTTQPSSTAPTTTAPTGQFTIGGNNLATTVTVGDPQWLIDQQASEEAAKNTTKSNVPSGKKNIIEAYVNGINRLKNEKNVTVTKASTLDFAIQSITINGKNDMSDTVVSYVQNFLNSNKPVDITYNFVNGLDTPTGQTPLSAIAPLGQQAKLSKDAVKSATAEKTVGGGYKIVIMLTDELQTHEIPAPNHSTTVEVIDTASLMPSGAKLNYLNILYSGTVIEATFDKDDRLVNVRHKLPVTKADGEGEMSIPLLGKNSATMEMNGEYNCTYNIKY